MGIYNPSSKQILLDSTIFIDARFLWVTQYILYRGDSFIPIPDILSFCSHALQNSPYEFWWTLHVYKAIIADILIDKSYQNIIYMWQANQIPERGFCCSTWLAGQKCMDFYFLYNLKLGWAVT